MGHKWVVSNKFRKLFHHIFTWRCGFHHTVTDTGIGFYKRTDPEPRVHQALKPMGDFVIFDDYRTDLDSSIAVLR